MVSVDEKVLFQSQQAQGTPPSVPATPPPSTRPAQPPMPPPPIHSGFFSKGMIVKAVIGIVVFLLVFLIFIRFILPLFGSKEKEVTLLYWSLWEDERTMKPLFDEFTKQHPNIKITYEKRTKEQYRNTLIARIDKGSGPDIFRFHNTWTPILQTKHYLSALPTEVISPKEFKEMYYPVVQEDLSIHGGIYGIPLGIDTLSMFVNTDILKAGGYSVPTNWIDFEKVVWGDSGVTVRNQEGTIETAGISLGTFNNVTHAPDIVSLFLVQNGADFYNLTNTKDAAGEALAYYTKFARGEGKAWDSTLDPSLLAFTQGKVAIYFGFSWDIFTIKSRAPDLTFSIHPVPNLGKKRTIASYWVEGISAKSKHQNEAFLFMQYLAQKETQQEFYKLAAQSRPPGAQFGPPYARRDLGAALKDDELAYPFIQQADCDADDACAVSSFFASDTFDGYNDGLNTYLGKAVDGVLGSKSPESAIEDLQKGVDQILTQYELIEPTGNP
ncbi:MAG: extracellular solute-binding protein [Candidatus Levybacteria bacterium]|nr:extracellular solute-binding protein [Candidatus Levybacteria bacterium]